MKDPDLVLLLCKELFNFGLMKIVKVFLHVSYFVLGYLLSLYDFIPQGFVFSSDVGNVILEGSSLLVELVR